MGLVGRMGGVDSGGVIGTGKNHHVEHICYYLCIFIARSM